MRGKSLSDTSRSSSYVQLAKQAGVYGDARDELLRAKAQMAANGLSDSKLVNSAGDIADFVSPAAGSATRRFGASIENALRRADMAIGDSMYRGGIPESLLNAQEEIPVTGLRPNVSAPGASADYQTRRIASPRASKLLAYTAAGGALVNGGLWVNNNLIQDGSEEPIMPLDAQKVAQAVTVLTQQNQVIRDLASTLEHEASKYAALEQAVKLAQDGLLDISDVLVEAGRIRGQGKMSSDEDVYSLGELL